MNNEDFSEWLVDQLDANGLNGWDLARMTGLSYQAVKYYIQGERTPKLATLGVILNVLNKRLQIVDS